MNAVLTESRPISLDRSWQQLTNGQFEPVSTGRELVDPGTGQRLCTVSEASAKQVQRAIRSARMARDKSRKSWGN